MITSKNNSIIKIKTQGSFTGLITLAIKTSESNIHSNIFIMINILPQHKIPFTRNSLEMNVKLSVPICMHRRRFCFS